MAIAAFVTWLVTAGIGFFMLTTWVRSGGLHTDGTASSNFRPPVVFSHFLLAAAGLVVWVVYVINDSTTLAWIAFADLVVVATLGDTLFLRWWKDRNTAAAGGAGSRMPSGGTTAIQVSPSAALAEQRIPFPAAAVHGLFAVATIVLVLLAALEIGGS
jgi:hypothetical protein